MRFLATMSHEIRTPLNGIVGALDLMRTSTAEKVPLLINTATNSADVLLELVSEVLDLARLEYGEGTPTNKPFNCRDLTEFIRLAMEPIARSKHLELQIEIDDAVPAYLNGDQRKIRQILVNLVGNALKFTETGYVRLSLRLLSIETGRATVEFSVEDTGVGIPVDEMSKIYEPFYTASSQGGYGTNSSGLGLAIVQKSAASIGATIECRSTLGKGTTFKLEVSLEIASESDVQPIALPAPVKAANALPARVLLVEDNDTNAMLVQDMLEGTDHIVERASGGLEAVGKAAENEYDIILMDISMPDLDGVHARRMIRAQRREQSTTKIVALTANAVVGDRERYLDEGFDGYLSKPIRKIRSVGRHRCSPKQPAYRKHIDPSR